MVTAFTSIDTRRKSSIVVALAMAAFLYNTSENIPIGLLRLLSTRFGVSLAAAGMLVTVYGLTIAVASLPLNRSTRRIPRRRLLSGVLALFVLASVASACADSYGTLMVARVAAALSQAVFWAVMAPVATGLFPAPRTGRVIAVLSVGGGAALILGVPPGTWAGQQVAWWLPFLLLGGLGLVPLLVVGRLLPGGAPGGGRTDRCDTPDPRRFAILLGGTALTAAALFTGFTYITAFLTDVGGFSARSIGALLMLFGVAGMVGAAAGGLLVDRDPHAAILIPVALQGIALGGLFLFGAVRPVAVCLVALLGASAAPFYPASQSRLLHIAPGRTETALAANSVAWNAGAAAGAAVGGVMLAHGGVRAAFLAGALLTLGAALVLLSERIVPRPSTRRHTTGSDHGD